MNMLKKYGKGGENIVEINKSNKKRTKSESGIVDSTPALQKRQKIIEESKTETTGTAL